MQLSRRSEPLLYARRKIFVAELLLLLFLFDAFIAVPTISAQQGGVGNIIGELRVSRGDFPGRIFVELQFRGATIASTYTDDEGKFGFNGLESNPYHVIIRDDQFYPVDQLVVLDTSISTLSMTQINLRLRETTQKESLRPPMSGGNPYLIDASEYRRKFPKAAVKEFDRGVDADRRQRREEAVRHYEKAVSIAPEFYPARNNLGSDYLSNSDFGNAEKQFREVLRTNQNDSQAYFNLGNVLTLTNRVSEAEMTIKEGLQRQPNSALGHFLMGRLYTCTHHYGEAERNLRDALQLDPKMSQVYLQLVNLYLQQGKKKDAMAELTTFLRFFPTDKFAPEAKRVLQRIRKETSPMN